MRSLSYRKGNLDKMAGDIVRSRQICEAGEFCKKGIFENWLPTDNRWVWAHIIPRDYLLTRWDLDNALCLHLGCERFYTSEPNLQKEMFFGTIGEDKYNKLRLKANNNLQPHPDYGNIRFELKKQYKSYLD